MRFCLLFACVSLISFKASADHKSVVDNDSLLAAYLHQSTFPIDSNASAIILYETGASFLYKNVLNYHVERTIKVLQKEGIAAAGEVRIPSFGKQTIKQIEGVTYNLNDGKIVRQSVARADVVDENVIQNYSVLKFNLPSIKIGSVVHYSFTIEYYTFAYIPEWNFQHLFPTLYSKYSVGIPKVYVTSNMIRSKEPFVPVEKLKQLDGLKAAMYQSEDGGRGQTNITWLRQQVPALKIEPYCKSSENYTERVKIHFSAIKRGGVTYPLFSSWKHVNEEYLFKGEIFSKPFRNNGFLKGKVASLTQGAENDLQKAQRIFEFVRDSFMLDPEKRVYQINLNKTFDLRRGTSKEINLLLVALLRRAKLAAEPVLVAPKPEEPLNKLYPRGQGTYTVGTVAIGGQTYFLDASRKYLPFGMLLPKCYNGFCWAINETGHGMILLPDNLHNQGTTMVLVQPDSDNINLVLSMDIKLGDVDAVAVRSKWKGDKTAVETAFKSKFNGGIFQLLDVSIDNLNEPDKPLLIHYKATAPIGDASILYLNPVFKKFYTENPLPFGARVHNIDVDYLTKNKYYLRFIAPKGYQITGNLKSIQLQSKDQSLRFRTQYKTIDTADQLVMSSSLSINKASFPVSEYENVRSFFEQLIAHQNEKIILKKIN